MYLKSFNLLKEYRGIKPFSVKFRDGINIIVGENGSGKSSILHLITSDNSKEFKAMRKIEFEPEATFKFFDTEKDNPRLKDAEFSKTFEYTVHSHFVSHGQAMMPILEAIKDFKNELIIIDEPEAGISIKNQKKLLVTFEKAIKNRCQIILTTHSYVIIDSIKEVFSLDCKKWITSKEYLE